MLYYTGSAYAKAKADVVSTAEIVGMVSRVLDANTFEVTLEGKVTGLSGLTAGTTYFLSASTAGAITATEPSTLGYVSLPVGVAISTTVIYVRTSRGAVVGSVNARTEIALANNTTTNVQSVSAYQAGELSGWVEIDGTTDLKFFVSAPFAKNGANSDYYISPSYVGDTPPVGFSLSITSGGLIQATLPSIAGYVSAKINFALNAPAVGATFPLAIDSTLVQFSTLKAKDSGGFVFQENGGTQIGSWDDAGAFTAGSSGSSVVHIFNGFSTNIVGTSLTKLRLYPDTNNVFLDFIGNANGTASALTMRSLSLDSSILKTIASATAGGNWTFSQSQASSTVTHTFYGRKGTIANQNYILNLLSDNLATGSSILRWGLDSTNGYAFQDSGIQGVGGGGYRFAANTLGVGYHDASGAWNLGPTTGTQQSHIFNGTLSVTSIAALASSSTIDLILRDNGTQKAQVGVYKNGSSASNGFLGFDEQGGGRQYLWSNAGTWYTSANASNIGDAAGTVVGTQTSDERLKTGIYDTTYGLDTVLNLRPINFSMHGKNQVGFSAQHTRMFLPEAVYDTGEVIVEGQENKLAMQYVQIIPVLTKAIQELAAKVSALESQLN
jgi:hypothetical protein